jgi:glycosyltransferase involved in cell wall biosynthesis
MLIGTIGQIGMRKGLDTLLGPRGESSSGTRRLLPDRRATVFTEAGGGRIRSRLHAMASQPPLAGRVRFLGLREDIPKLLNELTLLVHPARQEPLGRVLLEAAAAGVAVVATAVGGTPEIFSDGGSAVLVRPDDESALAAAMDRLLSDPAARRQLGTSRTPPCRDPLQRRNRSPKSGSALP